MKTENKVLLWSFLLGVFIWIADALFDYLFFYKGTFQNLILTDIPPHEIYIRSLILGCFIIFGFVCSLLIANQKKIEQKLEDALIFQQQLMDSVPIPIFYKNKEYIYTGCNRSLEDLWGMSRHEIVGKSVHDIHPPKLAEMYYVQDLELMNNPGYQKYEFEVKRKSDNSYRRAIFHKATFTDTDGQVAGIIGAILDVTERKKAEDAREELIVQLQNALNDVKKLSGFIPICASCKNIRDDKGFWNELEAYISEHSEAEFSHGICPDCAKKLYSEYNIGSKSKE